MTKKLLSIMLAAAMTLCAAGAFAGEADRLFIESTSTTAEVFSTDYLRGRILILDENNVLATTFSGADIAEADLTITAVVNGSDVAFTDKKASETTAASDFTIDSGDIIDIEDAWKEFAVNVDDVDDVGDETIRVTLKKGSSTITADLDITILAPKANCHVVLTGGLGAVPDVLEKITTNQADKGATKEAGDATTIDVLAAYNDGSDYYFTDNIPADMNNVSLIGQLDTLDETIQLAAGLVELTDGHVSTTIAVSNLNIPKYMAVKNQDSDNNYGFGAIYGYIWGYRCTTRAGQMAAMSEMLNRGVTVTWAATSGDTRSIGYGNNDVNSDEQISVSLTKDLASMSGLSATDISYYTPAPLKTITIVGIPVNTVDPANGQTGFIGTYLPESPNNVCPLDAYFLNSDATKKSSSVKVQGVKGTTKIYGAVVSYDRYNNPASISDDGGDIEIYFKRRTGNSSSDEAVNTTPGELFNLYCSAAGTAEYITNTSNYQAFFPFYMPAQCSSGTYASITNLYITSIKEDGTAISDTPFKDTVGTLSAGVSFYAYDKISAIAESVADEIGNVLGDDTEITITGQTGTGTDPYTLYAVRETDGSKMSLGAEDATSGSTSVSIPNDEDEVAKGKIVFFTSERSGNNIFMVFAGDQDKTKFVQPVTLTAAIAPAEGGDAEPSLIMSFFNTINAKLDPEEEHNVVSIGSGILVFDKFLNRYKSAFGGEIEDAELVGTVLKANEDGTASETESAHGVEFEGDKINVEFDLGAITANEDTFYLKLASSGGSATAQIKMVVDAMKSLSLKNLYLDVPGINDTPVQANFADQAGALIAPITVTAGTLADASKGNQLDVDFEKDNCTVTGISTTSAEQITTTGKKLVFTTKRDTGKSCLEITADPDVSGLSEAVLSLCFNPDFDKPTISSTAGGNCSIIITIADNEEVDTAGATVTVKNSDGEDITDTLTRTNTDSGATGTITLQTLQIGLYSAIITPKDAAGNLGDEETKTVSVTECSLAPACTGIEPVSALPGETVDVTITVNEDAPIGTGATVAFDCAGITINSTTVNSATEIAVNITVAADAAEATCALTISTPAQEITQDCEFTIGAPPAECIDADNDTYGEGCEAGDDCDDNNTAVNPGAAEVCDDGIDNNCDGQIDEGCEVACEIVSVSPGSISTGFGLLPRIRFLTITGNEVADFSNTSTVTFSPSQGITALTKSGSGDTIRVLVLIWGAAKGDVDISVDDCEGGTLTIQ